MAVKETNTMDPKRIETLSSKKYKAKQKATQPWFQTRLREKVAQENSFVILYKAKVRSNSPHFYQYLINWF